MTGVVLRATVKEPVHDHCSAVILSYYNCISDGSVSLFWRGVKVLKQSPYLECSTANTFAGCVCR